MACPVCGGMDREPVAPGYWRCTTLRTIIVEWGGPGMTHPAAGPGVLREERVEPCGTRYQEGATATALQCVCGTFAIGVCKRCGEARCGDHSVLQGAERICTAHLEEAEAERRQEAGRDLCERIQRWTDWEESVVEALSGAHPVER